MQEKIMKWHVVNKRVANSRQILLDFYKQCSIFFATSYLCLVLQVYLCIIWGMIVFSIWSIYIFYYYYFHCLCGD